MMSRQNELMRSAMEPAPDGGRDVQYAGVLALALSGEFSRSEALAGALEQRFPEELL